MMGLKVGFMIGENERLEEPGGMSQMPLRRAAIGHRLEPIVFHLERLAQPLGEPAHLAVPGGERLRIGGSPFTVGHGILSVSNMRPVPVGEYPNHCSGRLAVSSP